MARTKTALDSTPALVQLFRSILVQAT